MKLRNIFVLILLVSLACSMPPATIVQADPETDQVEIDPQPVPETVEAKNTPEIEPEEPEPTEVPELEEVEETEEPGETAEENTDEAPAKPKVIGPNPEDIPAGYNPLTGLPVDDPSLLDLPAVLISVTNFPVSARPQAGLSFAPIIYEIFIGEGQTRFLTVFYGDYPEVQEGGESTNVPRIGPIRSGRVSYGAVQVHFPGSCLVYASAYIDVRQRVPACRHIFGSDSDDINSAFINVTQLQDVAQINHEEGDSYNYSGNAFSEEIPASGADAPTILMFYNFLNQTLWEYSAEAGGYLRFNDLADGTGEFHPSTDRLTGEQLVFENVIILFVKHNAESPTIIDIALNYNEGNALIFRDGKAYKANWDTNNTEYELENGILRPIRFVDANGNPFPLAPGQTWVHVVTENTQAWEEAPGQWKIRFYAPVAQ